jgi:hypothetical protein
MRILVFSDTHKKCETMNAVIKKYGDTVQAIIHLGDCDLDLYVYKCSNDAPLPVYMVAGNCDNENYSKREEMLELEGFRVLITHGHLYVVHGTTDMLVKYAEAQNAAVCLFGHTHRSAMFTENGIFYMNPGSLSDPRDNKPPSYGLLELDAQGNKINGKILHP